MAAEKAVKPARQSRPDATLGPVASALLTGDFCSCRPNWRALRAQNSEILQPIQGTRELRLQRGSSGMGLSEPWQ